MPSIPDTREVVKEQQVLGPWQPLSDVSAIGRSRPWRGKHMGTAKVSEVFAKKGWSARAARLRNCGTVLIFDTCPQDGTKRLKRANFCRERLCPMCAWRRSLKWSVKVSDVLHRAAHERPKWRFIMLTLTQRNVPGSQLPDEVGRVLQAWTALTRRKEFAAVGGWLRTLEVTRNAANGTWHPHVHALLFVRPEYWAGRNYVSHAAWVAAWRDILGVDYDPRVDVHVVRPRKDTDSLGDAAREVAKYTVKDEDLVPEGVPIEQLMERVEVLHRALHGRRLLAWGGELRRIAHEVGATEKVMDEDLVHAEEEDHGPTCPICGSPMREEIYRWVAAAADYYRVASPPTRDDDAT